MNMINGRSMKKAGRFFIFFILISFGLFSCNSGGPILVIQHQFEGGLWTWNDPVIFDFTAPDTLEKYSLYLEVANQKDYLYQNLYTKIVTYFPDGDSTSQILSLDIFDKKGRQNGSCSGMECKVQFVMQENFTFRQEGDHKIVLYQQMRNDSLTFIQGVELQIYRQIEL